MSSGNSLGGGSSRGNVKNKKTYIGQDAGRTPGLLDQLLGLYAQGQQQANAQNDLLYGGSKYGNANQYFGNQGGGGQGGGGGRTPDPSLTRGGQGGPLPGEGDGGASVWNNSNDPDGTNRQREWAEANPQWDPGLSDQNAPTGGLVGQYGDWQSNPWQTGPNGDAETDVLGSYDWMSSGQRTDPESQVYGGYGDLGDIYGAGGLGNETGGTVEGDIGGFQQGEMGGGMNADEQDVANRLKGAAGGYGQMAGGPNAQEAALYGDTAKYGNTRGQDVGTASDTYRGMVEHGGYDDATKAAMTRESMSAARAPFEQSRDRILRGAAARGNVGSTQGAEIRLANQESGALGDTAARNQIAQAQEAIRQKEAGAGGLVGTQGVQNAVTQFALGQRAGQNAQQAGQKLAALGQQAGQNAQQGQQRLSALGQQAGQNAQLAGQKLAGLGGQVSTAGQLQAGTAAQRGYRQAGAAGLSDLTKQAQAGRQAGLAGQAGQNQALRNQQLAGTQGKQGLFDTMFGRRQVGTAGLQGLYNTGQQQRAGDLAGLGNVGGKTFEDYVESGTGGGGI